MEGHERCRGDITFWQNIYVKFYQAFIEADRWKQYLEGMATTLYVTVIAILIGIVLGVIVASIRTAHDQQRRKKNIVLGFFNAICKIYVTVIRGTPMMVQLMILGFVVFKSSRNFTMVGALGLGLNSGAYVAEIIRGGLMSLDQGYMDTLRFIVVPQAFKAVLPALGNEFIILLKDTSLLTIIGGKELVHAAQGIMNRTWEQMFPLLGISFLYLVMVLILSWLQGKLERRLRQSER